MANTRLTRTLGTPTNRKKLTASLWVKKSFNGVEKHFFGMSSSGGYLDFRFASTGELELYHYNSGYQFRLTTTRKFRDTNGWLHLVFTIDTTLATADDRFKVYVNGVQETVFTNRTNPSQDYDIPANISGNTISVGNYGTNTGNSFDGIISHVHFSDGYAYDPTPFGETDSTTGEWKIKTSVTGVTYGTNGFWWLKDSIATTDHSPNSNTFTVASGTLTKTEDCPSNVFCTINPLDNYYGGGTLSNGNTKIQTGGSSIESYTLSTLGASSGKYYCEMKLVSSTSAHKTRLGIAYEPTNTTSDFLGKKNSSWSYNQTGEVTNNNSSVGGTWSSYTAGDIIGMAFNLDDLQGGLHKLYYSKNGVWQNGADPSNHSSTTGVVGITADKTYLIGIGDETGGYSVCELNFGNGYFGTTAVSSAGTNASGIGIFEYDVPTGYTALSTKGLNL